MNVQSDKSRELLGLNADITRRDFVGTTLIASGAALLGTHACGRRDGTAAAWNGPGGVGDYSDANGNIRAVIDAAHGIRDGFYGADPVRQVEEEYELVVVGGGLAGLAAAYQYVRRGGKSCLIIENHPIFGGEAKANEFKVGPYRLIGPQGSNDTAVPGEAMGLAHEIWNELGIPREFDFAALSGTEREIRFAKDNYIPMHWNLDAADTAYYFDDNKSWARNIWLDGLSKAPWSSELKKELLRWRFDKGRYGPSDGRDAWLDSMSYADLLHNIMKFPKAVADYVDPIVSVAAYGVSADAVSAYAAKLIRLPGASEYPERDPLPTADKEYFGFPGGNSAIARHFVKRLIPDSIRGGAAFSEVLNNNVDFDALDRPGSQVRIRVNSTAIAVVERAGEGDVAVSYVKNGARHNVSGKAVVMASGNWVNKHIVHGFDDERLAAFDAFCYAPMLVVNVALRNWRCFEKMGASAIRWFDGLGFFANIRRPMKVGKESQPFDPSKPVILTLYIGFPKPGRDARTQGALGRQELFSTSYADYEILIRERLNDMLGAYGFDARRDIAGIILNRWGHAYTSPQPGFFFGTGDSPAPSVTARRPFGRICFGHSQLRGHQNWPGAVSEGVRAANEAIEMI